MVQVELAEAMGSDGALEGYLRTAPILHVRDLPGGGGHSDKKTVILRGGVGVAAKPALDSTLEVRARCEVAAWITAVELEMGDLVPATVLRQVPAPQGEFVEGSAQVLWPRFIEAQRHGINPSQVPDEVGWRIAVFDHLIANTDRNDGNWGVIDDLPDVALVDHGHSFAWGPGTSPFAETRAGQSVPPALLERVEAFATSSDTSRLWEMLDDRHVRDVIARAQHLLQNGALP